MGYAASAERVVLWDTWPCPRELYFVVYGASAERVVLWDTWPQLRELYCGIRGLS